MKYETKSQKNKFSNLAKGIAVFLAATAFLLSAASCEKNIEYPDEVKPSPYPERMIRIQPETEEDIIAAQSIIRELEDAYGTEFVMLGIERPWEEHSLSHMWSFPKETGVRLVYAYSIDYPEVYISRDKYGSDHYLDEVEAWKTENEIYEIAKQLGIDTNLMCVDVDWATNGANGSRIFASVMANQQIPVSEIKKLSVEVQKYHTEVVFHSVRTEIGDAKQYFDWLSLNPLNPNNFKNNEFGKYWKVEITTNGKGHTVIE